MKKLLLVFLLLFSITAIAQTQSQAVQQQIANNNMGQTFIRLHNTSNLWVGCYYQDAYNYFTFSIAPNSVTNWNPVYGRFEWQCYFL